MGRRGRDRRRQLKASLSSARSADAPASAPRAAADAPADAVIESPPPSIRDDRVADPTAGGAIRQSLERAAQRLRRVLAEGKDLTDAERLLNLMRNLRILGVGDGSPAISAPLVCVETWRLEPGGSIEQHLAQRGRKLTTPFSSSMGGKADARIHDVLTAALERYLDAEGHSGLLFDLVSKTGDSAPSESENDGAYFPATAGSHHPLFEGVDVGALPVLFQEVSALIRVTFPLRHARPPYLMATIVLGLMFLGAPPAQFPPTAMAKLVDFTRTLVDEVPRLFGDLPPAPRARGAGAAHPHDILHAAVNHLHEEIAALAHRYWCPGWNRPQLGFNFLIAFREVDPRALSGVLRYCLTDLNTAALGVDVASKEDWLRRFESKRDELRDALGRAILRTRPDLPTDEWMNQAKAHEARGFAELTALFDAAVSVDDVRRRLHDQIEGCAYPTHLTPGSSVMKLGFPELIKQWLRDPRAQGEFVRYPPLLLAWENLSLPEALYYSPIAEGRICFGVCGVDASLLQGGGAHAVQQIIDDAGPKLRKILMQRAFEELKSNLRAAGPGTSNAGIWAVARAGLRRVAYYTVPGENDYSTKLVWNKDVPSTWRWEALAGYIKRLRGPLTEDVLFQLQTIRQAEPPVVRPGDGVDYINRFLDQGSVPDLAEAKLYQLNLNGAPGCSLLILVPLAENHSLMEEFFLRFVAGCHAALQPDLADLQEHGRLKEQRIELWHTLKHVLDVLSAGLSRMSDEKAARLRLLIDILHAEGEFLRGEHGAFKIGDVLVLQDLFALFESVHETLRWCLEIRDNKPLGPLEGIRTENLDILRKGLGEVELGRASSAAIGINRAGALLLVWELALNLCVHVRSKLGFEVRAARGGIELVVTSDTGGGPEDRSGRHGVSHMSEVASWLGIRFNSGFSSERKDEYLTSVRFEQEGR